MLSREGFPITFRVFEGPRLDDKTLKEMFAQTNTMHYTNTTHPENVSALFIYEI